MTNNQLSKMKDPHTYRGVIPPVQPGVHRPLWSVMIPTYNCAHYLRNTLTSVLSQDTGKEVMQIEVVDDHSTKDDPEAVVQELGRGRVSFYRQPQNVGHVKNFATCLERSQGQLIHILHGDDLVRDRFYVKLQQAFIENPEIGAAFCRTIQCDECGHWRNISILLEKQSGILSDWLERIAVCQYLQTPSIVVRRDVYEKLGGFDRRIKFWGEDWEMWVRIAAHYPVWYETEPLAIYRHFRSDSLSEQSIRTGKNIQDILRATEIIQTYLPASKKQEILRRSKSYWAQVAITYSRQLLQKGDISGAIAQICEALRCSRSFRVLKASVRVWLNILQCMLSDVGDS